MINMTESEIELIKRAIRKYMMSQAREMYSMKNEPDAKDFAMREYINLTNLSHKMKMDQERSKKNV